MALEKVATENYHVFKVSDKPVSGLCDRGQWWLNAGCLLPALGFSENSRTSALTVHVEPHQAVRFNLPGEKSNVWISEEGLRGYRSKRVGSKREIIDALLKAVEKVDRKHPPIRVVIGMEEDGRVCEVLRETGQEVVAVVVDPNLKDYDSPCVSGRIAGSPYTLIERYANYDPQRISDAFTLFYQLLKEAAKTNGSHDEAQPESAESENESDAVGTPQDESRADDDPTEEVQGSPAVAPKPASESDESASESDESASESDERGGTAIPAAEPPIANDPRVMVLVRKATGTGAQMACDLFCAAFLGILNAAAAADPKTTWGLLLTPASCDKALAEHPELIAHQFGDGSMCTTPLAIFNAILQKTGLPPVIPAFDEKTGAFIGFRQDSSRPKLSLPHDGDGSPAGRL